MNTLAQVCICQRFELSSPNLHFPLKLSMPPAECTFLCTCLGMIERKPFRQTSKELFDLPSHIMLEGDQEVGKTGKRLPTAST
jgi:hypothetical protein